jgi:hypothetical protein
MALRDRTLFASRLERMAEYRSPMSDGRPHLTQIPQIQASLSRSVDDVTWQPTCPSWMRLLVAALS